MKPRDKQPGTSTPIDWLARIEHLLLAALLGLLTIALLTPSDTPPGLGVFVVQAMLWTALGAAFMTWLVLSREVPRWTIADLLATLWLGWTLLATWNVRGTGDLRGAINGFFQTTAVVLLIVIGPRLLRTSQRRREALSLLLSLGLLLALLGLTQYFVTFPHNHAQVRANPHELLALQGIADENSPEARRLLDRYLSPEPLATFTLTNSLASVLAPLVVLVVAAGWSAWQAKINARLLIVAGVSLGCLLVCLLLTKSRTAMLACTVGVGIFAATRSRFGERIPMRWMAATALVLALLLGVVAMLGVLDRELLSQAPNSVLFRLQYWQSTLAMIGDHFLLGCGPGNFQSVYPHYKLAEASEEIGDPHNFLLEIAATAGLPAAILFVALVWTLLSARRPTTSIRANEVATPRWMLGGAVVGLLLVLPTTVLAGGDIAWLPLLIGIPVLIAGERLLRPLVSDDFLRSAALPVAALTALINLLAAGGIGFPNVVIPLALLLVLSQQTRRSEKCGESETGTLWLDWSLALPKVSAVALIISLALMTGCFLLSYVPVLAAQANRHIAEELAHQGQPLPALDELELASRADPYNAELSWELGRFQLQLYKQRPAAGRLEAALAACDVAVARNRRSYALRLAAGSAYQQAWRISSNDNHLQRAIELHLQAVERYPNFSVLHAHLAWSHALAGNYSESRDAAREALRLDALSPHEDKKLSKHHLNDPGLSASENLPLDELMHGLLE